VAGDGMKSGERLFFRARFYGLSPSRLGHGAETGKKENKGKER
jgi:hypothetical protein